MLDDRARRQFLEPPTSVWALHVVTITIASINLDDEAPSFNRVELGTTQDMTIFDSLREDHETQRTLADLVVKTTGDSDERKELWERLKRELEAHAGAEERYFYIPLIEHDRTQEKARHSVSEHKELDDFIEQLDEYDMGGPQWLQTAKELVERLTHHLDEEEHEVFQIAGKVLSEADKESLATEYEADIARRRQDA